MDLTLRMVCPMGPSLSPKYDLPKSLHCELTWHMLDRKICIGKSTMLDGLCSSPSNERGRKRTVTVSWKEREKKQRICVLMDEQVTLSQAS